MTSIAALAFLGLATAQTFTDRFDYPPGTTIPGYTEQWGNWTATGGTIRTQTIPSHQHLTRDGSLDRDACVEVLAHYDVFQAQASYLGPVLGHVNMGIASQYLVLRLEDAGAPSGGWDSFGVYRYVDSLITSLNVGGTLTPPARSVRARLQVTDEPGGARHVQVFLDTNLDGLWDVTRDATPALVPAQAGRFGVAGFGPAIADDLRYFDATLYLFDPPRVGNPVRFFGRGLPSRNWQGACSLGHSGIPIGGGRAIPLDADALLSVSLSFPGFAGVTDASGNFTMILSVPSAPALVGLRVWCSAVTWSAGIDEIAPDVEVTIVP
jgi:hypothetical protein